MAINGRISTYINGENVLSVTIIRSIVASKLSEIKVEIFCASTWYCSTSRIDVLESIHKLDSSEFFLENVIHLGDTCIALLAIVGFESSNSRRM